ncbi:MAG: transporter substrate-binding domain-containing protein [Anaerolineae bacterium]|nr:transporter substrate-binding domain-containing protein [Anaerolineae bacterium]
MRHKLLLIILCMAFLAVSVALAQDTTEEPTGAVEPGPTLKAVQDRGLLSCGINEDLFGFGFLNPNTGAITGIFADFCTAIATAVFADPVALDYQLLPDDAPMDALLDGELDVMFLHGLSQVFSEDANTPLDFGPTIFYDGQSIMVRSDSSIETWEDLEGETVCTLANTPAETAIRDEMQRRGVTFELLTFDSGDDLQESFMTGRCDAQTLDRSLLELRRQSTDVPADFVVWDEPFTRTSLRPIYRYGDKQWTSIVDWTLLGLIRAEELGITSENIGDLMRIEGESDDAYLARVGEETARLIDATFGLGSQLGLPNNFMAPVIQQVGNYGEIYNRHLGPDSALPISRGLNALWQDGGSLNVPPWR